MYVQQIWRAGLERVFSLERVPDLKGFGLGRLYIYVYTYTLPLSWKHVTVLQLCVHLCILNRLNVICSLY